MNIDQETDEIIKQLRVGRFDNGKMTKRVIKLLTAYKAMNIDLWNLVEGGEFYSWLIKAERKTPLWLAASKEFHQARQHFPEIKNFPSTGDSCIDNEWL